MRTIDGAPLDEARLLFLLDGLYPTYFTAFPAPPNISASVDLRADLLTELTPDTSPEGWATFHFTSRDIGGGWAVRGRRGAWARRPAAGAGAATQEADADAGFLSAGRATGSGG